MPLLDPLCGSGTIVIEAALIALDIAPGLKRTFGFQKLAWYDGPTWQRIKQAAQRRMKPGALAGIYASDDDAPAVARCAANLAAAGVAAAVAVERASALARPAPAASRCHRHQPAVRCAPGGCAECWRPFIRGLATR